MVRNWPTPLAALVLCSPYALSGGDSRTAAARLQPARQVWLLDQAKSVIDALARGVELAAAVVIGIAALEATIKALSLFVRRNAPPEYKNEVRLTLGRWLAVGLEFELAADILRTAVTPTWHDVEQLAAIAALRTALNYFLAKEIEKESSAGQRRAEQIALEPREEQVR